MKALELFFESTIGKRVKNAIIGVGASVVLLGALFKLQHWPGASEMLIVGMTTEVVIFLLMGILPPHADYYWEKFYPGITVSPHEEEHGKEIESVASQLEDFGKQEVGAPQVVQVQGGLTQKFDEMLSEANFEPEMFERLSKNMGKLGDNLEAMSDISEVAGATSEYAESARGASTALNEMKVAYQGATSSIGELTTAASGTQEYQEQIQKMSQNLSTLNSIYELELQDTNNHLKALNKFYGAMGEAMNSVEEAKDDAIKYRNEMANLSQNLTSLNQVYGNILSAMSAGQTQS